jgi:uncharacterized protein (DUF1800 family)
MKTAARDLPEETDSARPASIALAAAGGLIGMAGCGMIRDSVQNITGTVTPTFVPLPRTEAAQQALHVLNRIGYGPEPGEVTRVASMGAKAYIEEQIAGKGKENPLVTWRVNALDVMQNERDSPDTLDVMPDEQLLRETQQAVLLRALYSRHQLRETLADFWTNHFNIYALKSQGRILIPTDAEHVIRPHILGTFREMLLASAHSPAMLQYLDNQENKKGVANENYARELLELHTLGVDSGYTLKDIQEVARCFTGWRIRKSGDRNLFAIGRNDFPTRDNPTQGRYNGFYYDAEMHDTGAKFIPFLNLHIEPNGGKQDADTVLEALAMHPATARFLARKLCRRYLGHAPGAVVQKAADAYLKNDTSIQAMLKPILLDALLEPSLCRPVVKRPIEYAVSALRVLGADADGGAGLQKHLADMGQPLYQWPMPDGFPEKASAWTGSLLSRWNFALALTSNAIPGIKANLNLPLEAAKVDKGSDEAKLNALLETVLHQPADSKAVYPLREQVRRHIARAREAKVSEQMILSETVALLIASPHFQER